MKKVTNIIGDNILKVMFIIGMISTLSVVILAYINYEYLNIYLPILVFLSLLYVHILNPNNDSDAYAFIFVFTGFGVLAGIFMSMIGILFFGGS